MIIEDAKQVREINFSQSRLFTKKKNYYKITQKLFKKEIGTIRTGRIMEVECRL